MVYMTTCSLDFLTYSLSFSILTHLDKEYTYGCTSIGYWTLNIYYHYYDYYYLEYR